MYIRFEQLFVMAEEYRNDAGEYLDEIQGIPPSHVLLFYPTDLLGLAPPVMEISLPRGEAFHIL